MSGRESLLKPFTQIMFIQNCTSNVSQLSIHNHIFLGMQIIYCFCILLPLTSKLNLNCRGPGAISLRYKIILFWPLKLDRFRCKQLRVLKVILADWQKMKGAFWSWRIRNFFLDVIVYISYCISFFLLRTHGVSLFRWVWTWDVLLMVVQT